MTASVVVGAGGGIGSATARLLASRGDAVAVADLDLEAAAGVAAQIESSGGSAVPLQADIRSDESIRALVDAATASLGGIDALVNAAGVVKPGPSESVSDPDWQLVLDAHVNGTFRCARAAFPALARSGHGAIVNISSVAGEIGLPERASYCTAKAAIRGLTRTLAVEWAEHGIRVNAVAPGYIRTKPVATLIERGVIDESRLRARIPLNRLGAADEVASVIAFLASPAASYVTGHVLTVDAGLTVSAGF